jgi:hypothetical protein
MNPWKKIHDDFQKLKEEEDHIVRQRVRQDFSNAYVSYGESGEVECWIQSMATEGLQAGFESVGTEAGLALGPPLATAPLKYWFQQLFLNLRANNSDHIQIYSDTVATIEHLLEASATYCLQLDRQFVEGSAMPGENDAKGHRRNNIKTRLPGGGSTLDGTRRNQNCRCRSRTLGPFPRARSSR